ncbi:MAG: integration host factor subunit alpha [Hyphomicrobiales bacterium]|nr:integration host factor subunit alpha [Hyphomicrobiales bacterium]
MASRKDRTITRAELAEAVCRASGLPRSDAGEMVGQVLGMISEIILRGEPVLLSGFGKFLVVQRAARRARNVRAGLEVMIGARKALVFKPAIGLLQQLAKASPAPAVEVDARARKTGRT